SHPVVHQWAFHIQSVLQRAELSQLAAVLIGYAAPNNQAEEYHQKRRQLIPHIESWMQRMDKITANTTAEDYDDPAALHMMGELLGEEGNMEKSEKMYQRALKSFK